MIREEEKNCLNSQEKMEEKGIEGRRSTASFPVINEGRSVIVRGPVGSFHRNCE